MLLYLASKKNGELGYSAGGTIALRYTELCNQSPESFPVRPKCVLTVDSPVDIIDYGDILSGKLPEITRRRVW